MLSVKPILRKASGESKYNPNLDTVRETARQEGILPRQSFHEVKGAFAALTFSAIDMHALRKIEAERRGKNESLKDLIMNTATDSMVPAFNTAMFVFAVSRNVLATLGVAIARSVTRPVVMLLSEYNFRKWSSSVEKRNEQVLAALAKEMKLPSSRMPEDIGIDLALRAVRDVCPRSKYVFKDVSQIDRLKYFWNKVKDSDSKKYEYINDAFRGKAMERQMQVYEASKVRTLGAISLYLASGKGKDLKFIRESLSQLHNDAFNLKFDLYIRLAPHFPKHLLGVFELFNDNSKVVLSDLG